MANYTQTFKRYIEEAPADLHYPAIFDEVWDLYDGYTFKDAFYDRYALCEIGFETYGEFWSKFPLKSYIKLPRYIKLMDMYNKIYNDFRKNVDSSAKDVTETIINERTVNGTSSTDYTSPISGTITTDNIDARRIVESTINKTTPNDGNIVTKTSTPIYGNIIIDYFNGYEAISDVYTRMIKSFEGLFMGVVKRA